MKVIRIDIANKRAAVLGANSPIVCGNKGAKGYSIQFSFDEEWVGLDVKTARFVFARDGIDTYTDVVFSGDTVEVPELSNTREVKVGVYSGDLCTTTPARIPCVPSILCGGGLPADPSPDVYAQIMDLLNAGGGVAGESIPYIESLDTDNPVLLCDIEGEGLYYLKGYFKGSPADEDIFDYSKGALAHCVTNYVNTGLAWVPMGKKVVVFASPVTYETVFVREGAKSSRSVVDMTTKEDTANMVQSVNGLSTANQYPSAKAVWDLFSSIGGGDSGGTIDPKVIEPIIVELGFVYGGDVDEKIESAKPQIVEDVLNALPTWEGGSY